MQSLERSYVNIIPSSLSICGSRSPQDSNRKLFDTSKLLPAPVAAVLVGCLPFMDQFSVSTFGVAEYATHGVPLIFTALENIDAML